MDSLLANYASSDEADDEGREDQQQDGSASETATTTTKTSEPSARPPITSSLPRPKSSSSSLFLSLPQTKSHHLPTSNTVTKIPSLLSNKEKGEDKEESDSTFRPSSKYGHHSDEVASKTSPFFSSLPPPKSYISNPQTLADLSSAQSSSSAPSSKRVIQFKPPINPSLIKSQEDESDDEDRENDRNKLAQQSESTRQQPSVKSFLLSMPVPKTTVAALGALPSSGAGTRRSIVETNMSAPNSSDFTADTNLGINQSMGNFENLSSSSVGELNGQLQPEASAGEFMNWAPVDHNYGNYESYGNYGNYDGNWVDVAAGITQEAPTLPESSVLKMPRKRGRNEGPIEIVEVKQDELIKNRPREDQVKLTGIAFGPSYQVLP